MTIDLREIARGFAAFVSAQIPKTNFEEGRANTSSYLSPNSVLNLYFFIEEQLVPILEKHLNGEKIDKIELTTESSSGKSISLKLDRDKALIIVNDETILVTSSPVSILSKDLPVQKLTSEDTFRMFFRGEI